MLLGLLAASYCHGEGGMTARKRYGFRPSGKLHMVNICDVLQLVSCLCPSQTLLDPDMRFMLGYGQNNSWTDRVARALSTSVW